MFVNDALQHKCLMDGAVLWPVACLSGRTEALLLCVLDQALNQDASIQPIERFAHCNWSVVSCICRASRQPSPLLKVGVTSEIFHNWALCPRKAVLKSSCKQGSRRCSGAGSAPVQTSLA